MEYELARENPRVQEAVALLTPERRREIEALNEEDWEKWKPEWIEGERFWQFWGIFRACWYCGQFPKPWMKSTVLQHAIAVERFGKPPSPLRILTKNDLVGIELLERIGSALYEADTGSIRRYTIQIDWSHDDPLLKRAFRDLLNLRPKGTRPHKRHTGKRAANPMHKLKQLAAWRLATKAGLSFKEAGQLVDQRRRDCPRDDSFDLLPCYRSPGAWKDAVDAGQKLVRRGY